MAFQEMRHHGKLGALIALSELPARHKHDKLPWIFHAQPHQPSAAQPCPRIHSTANKANDNTRHIPLYAHYICRHTIQFDRIATVPATDFLSTICHSQFEQYTFIGLTTMPSPYLTQLRKWMLESPPVEWGINQLRELLIGALRQGSIPQHVAFVMDGNRRFARSHKIETVEGHNLGFEALAKVCAQ